MKGKSRLQTGSPGSESCSSKHNPEVGGSNPPPATNSRPRAFARGRLIWRGSSAVELRTHKPSVVGSNPTLATRSAQHSRRALSCIHERFTRHGAMFGNVIQNYYLVQGSLLAFLELFGIGIAAAIFVSARRARTESGRYIYSPTRRPTQRTPKLVFLPLPLLVSTMLVTIGVRDIWHGLLGTQAIFITTILLWIVFISVVLWAILLIATTWPLEGDPPDSTPNHSNSSSGKHAC